MWKFPWFQQVFTECMLMDLDCDKIYAPIFFYKKNVWLNFTFYEQCDMNLHNGGNLSDYCFQHSLFVEMCFLCWVWRLYLVFCVPLRLFLLLFWYHCSFCYCLLCNTEPRRWELSQLYLDTRKPSWYFLWTTKHNIFQEYWMWNVFEYFLHSLSVLV